MYKGYNLTISEKFFDNYLNFSEVENVNKFTEKEQKEIEKFFTQENALSGQAMINSWFPEINAQVFISHSHKDEALAIKLAKWLKNEFNISSFVDSTVWDYSPKLLKKLDDEFCYSDYRKTYNYHKRNITNSHVNIMLLTSLLRMIDKCETIIFLNTPNSISCKKCIDQNETQSPWLYAELEITNFIKKKAPRENQSITDANIFESFESNDVDFSISYQSNMGHLIPIQEKDLIKWQKCGKKDNNALDFLYNSI